MMRKRILTLGLTAALIAAVLAPTAARASSSCWYSPRGCVYVNPYYKPSTGTYVRPHVRNYPGYKTPSYKAPSYKAPSYPRW
jgi:hypothetical protein